MAGFANLAFGGENKLGHSVGGMRGLNADSMGQIAGLLGFDLSKEDNMGLFSKLFKMYPHMLQQQQSSAPPTPPGGGTGGGGVTPPPGGGGGPGTDPNAQWNYPGLLNAPYMMTNWYGK